MKYEFAVVICTHNRHELLRDAIDSVLQQSIGRARYHVIVVDNSTDHALAAAQQTNYRDVPGLDYLVESEPGLANARNAALRHCEAEFVAFIDDDARAELTWLAALAEAFRGGDGVGVVGGRVDPLWLGEVPRWLAGEVYADVDDLAALEWHNRVRPMIGNLSVVNWGDRTRPIADGEWLAGTNICFRAAPLRELGGFDTQLGRRGAGMSLLSNEESAVMRALQRQGWQAVYAPAARVRHIVHAERLDQAWFAKRLAWQVVSDMLEQGDTFRFSPQQARDALARFRDTLPPGTDALAALLKRFDDPQRFDRQMFAVVALMRLLLSGVREPVDGCTAGEAP